MTNTDILILGAGIAGLGAAKKARELGREALIVEASQGSGGLLDNFSIDGYRFDNAVHLSFATEPEVRAVFDQTEYYTHPSDSNNFDNDIWLKHPVQNNLYPLPAEAKADLLTSFMARTKELAGDDYESWLRYQYGHRIAERYHMRYTRKYWQCEANELSIDWIGNRVRQADAREILFGSYTSETPNTYYTKEMRYPKKGGYKAFIQDLIDSSDIRLGHKAISVDVDAKTVTFANHETIAYNQLVSSIPLPILTDICQSVPTVIRDEAKKLEATSIDLISVGFSENIIKELWFYIYDDDILASRAYSPSVKSPENAPIGSSSLQFEIYNPGRTSQYSPERLKENVSYALEKMKIATPEQIKFLHHKHLTWGNVVFKKGTSKSSKLVKDYFTTNEVATVGRFGEWEYLWSNQSFMSGYSALS